MRKIRVNELARECEQPNAVILALLPEYGVTEKKTHSSSIEEDVANEIRRRFGVFVEEKAETAEVRPEEPAAPEVEEAEAPAAEKAPAIEAEEEPTTRCVRPLRPAGPPLLRPNLPNRHSHRNNRPQLR